MHIATQTMENKLFVKDKDIALQKKRVSFAFSESIHRVARDHKL